MATVDDNDQEKTNVPPVSDDDDDDEQQHDKDKESDSSDDDDDNVRGREAAFNKGKQSNNAASNRSIRRYDEYGDFITRSERARVEKEQAVKAAQETTKPDGKKGFLKRTSSEKRSVQFQDDDRLVVIQEIPELTESEIYTCFLGPKDCKEVHPSIHPWLDKIVSHSLFPILLHDKIDCKTGEAIDLDIDLTEKRWKYHTEGLMRFDEEKNTLRGVEVRRGLIDWLLSYNHVIDRWLSYVSVWISKII